MARFLAQARFIVGAFAIALILAVTVPAGAQQPSSVNPTAASVKEQQLLNALGSGGAISGLTCSTLYHFRATANYGSTKAGAYMCEQDARAQGMRAAKNEKRPT